MTPDDYWFPWFPARFRRKTLHLSLEQRAIYRDLIDYYMEARERLPDSDAALARIVGISTESFAVHAAVIRGFFIAEDGFLYHEFCAEQLDEQDEKTRFRKKRAKKAAKDRWSKVSEFKRENANSINQADHEHQKTMLGDATGQDKTRQDSTDNLNLHRTKLTKLVTDDFFETPKKTKTEKIKPHRLPDDWAPDIDLGEWAMARGLTRAEVLTEIEAFKNHWKASAGKSSLKLDWDAAFRTWAINAVKYKTERKMR